MGNASVLAETLDRLRAALAGRDEVVEKRMVGGRSFLYRGRMFCGATSSGLMVRVGTAGQDAALAEPHVRLLEFGRRPVDGFVVVDPAGYPTAELLEAWLERGLRSVR